MQFAGFCGGSAANRSLNVNAERTINLYTEVPAGMPKASPVLQSTPGLTPYCALPDSPVRTLYYHVQRCFAIAGSSLYEIFGQDSFTLRGSVTNGYRPATIVGNGNSGHQLFIVSEFDGYIYDLDTDTLTAITDPQFPLEPLMGEFIDGYFVALASNTIYLSDLYNGMAWDGLMVAQRSLAADELVSIVVNHRELWMLGAQRAEVWYNTGATFPLEPIPSAGVIEQGCLAPFSAIRCDNSIIWVGADERGGAAVYRAAGFNPQRISTHAVEHALLQFGDLRQIYAWTYQEGGHTFYVLFHNNLIAQGNPGGPAGSVDHTTWVYDAATGEWHERALWRPELAKWEQHIARCHCYDYIKQVHLVGDRQGGTVYRMSLDLYDEQIVMS